MNLSMKQKETYRPREQTCGCQGGLAWEEMEWEVGTSRCTNMEDWEMGSHLSVFLWKLFEYLFYMDFYSLFKHATKGLNC